MSRNTKPLTRNERQALALAPGVDDPAPDVDDGEAGAVVVKQSPERRPLRSEHREDMSDLKALANRIAALPPGQRRALPLEDETREQVELLVRADGAGRRRLLMRVKGLLGAGDLGQLQAALAGDGPAEALDRECVRWRTRLMDGDDAVLQLFVAAHPGSDRQALRASIRDARGVGPAAERARTRLLVLVREASPVAGQE